MRVVVIGSADDVRGFNLAGVNGAICDSRDAVQRQVSETLADDSDSVLVFSPAAGELIADLRAAWRREGDGPAHIVLPG